MAVIKIDKSTIRDDLSFEYEKSFVVCSNCSQEIPFNAIQEVDFFNVDGIEDSAEVCPKCGAEDTFNFSFEKLSEEELRFYAWKNSRDGNSIFD